MSVKSGEDHYDAAGNATRITYPDAKQVNYTYNAANQLATVTDWASRITTYGYDAAGRLSSITNSNGTTVAMTYDAAGRLTAYTDTVNANTYLYDAAGNLTKEVNPNLAPPPVGTVTMAYDNANRITTFNDTAVTHDADGNMTRGPIGAIGSLGAPVFADFTWDSRNRLTAVSDGKAYVYDGENNRVQANTARYVINPHVRLSQVLMETNTSGTPNAWYVYGLGLIGREDASGYKTYHYDRCGSTVALSGAGGAVTDTYKYAAYGELVSHIGATVQPFAYNGRDGVMDEGNGLSFLRARYRAVASTRFLSRDTVIAGGFNRFAYVNADPMSKVDPKGLSAEPSDCVGNLSRVDCADIFGETLANAAKTFFDGLRSILNVKLNTSPASIIPKGGFVAAVNGGNLVGGAAAVTSEFVDIHRVYTDPTALAALDNGDASVGQKRLIALTIKNEVAVGGSAAAAGGCLALAGFAGVPTAGIGAVVSGAFCLIGGAFVGNAASQTLEPSIAGGVNNASNFYVKYVRIPDDEWTGLD